MGQPAPVVRLLWISWPVAALSAIRLRYVYLRPAGVQRRVWPRLDRQRTADSAAPNGRCGHREDRDHGGVDHRDPSDRQRLGGILGGRAADRIRHLFGSLHAFRTLADRCGFDGALRRGRGSRQSAGDSGHVAALNTRAVSFRLFQRQVKYRTEKRPAQKSRRRSRISISITPIRYHPFGFHPARTTSPHLSLNFGSMPGGRSLATTAAERGLSGGKSQPARIWQETRVRGTENGRFFGCAIPPQTIKDPSELSLRT